MTLSPSEYALILEHDFLSFAHRAFVELNPQISLSIAPHLEVIAAKLEACRRGQITRLVINLPPRQLTSHLASIDRFSGLVARPQPGRTCDLRQLRSGAGRKDGA